MSHKYGTKAVVTAGLCAALTLSGAVSAYADPVATETVAVSTTEAPAAAVDAWDGSVDISWYSENDTKAEYTLTTAEQLAGLAQLVNGGSTFNGKTVKLEASLDLSGHKWAPIGTEGKAFQGTFVGTGYSISGLTINNPDLVLAGLFGYIVSPAKIVGVTIQGASVTAKASAGALAGSAFTGAIENCKVTGSVKIAANYKVGGLVGEGYATIKSCSVDAERGSSVIGTYMADDFEGDNVGGLVGYRGEGADIVTQDCSVSNLYIEGTRKVGGLIGSAFDNNKTTDCSVSSVSIVCNASLEYAQGKSSSIGIGGVIGLFTHNSNGDGELSGITASNVTLDVVDQSLSAGNIVSCGYISGGQRGDAGLVAPSESMKTSNIILFGNNAGQRLSDGLASIPAVSGSPDVNQTAVAVVGSKQFDSLDNAVGYANQLQAPSTIQVVSNVSAPGIIEIGGNYPIELNLANKTIDLGESGGLQIKGNGVVSVVGNGVITSSNVSEGTSAFSVNAGSSAVLDGVEVHGGYCAVRSYGALDIKAAKIDSTTFGIGVFGGAKVTIGEKSDERVVEVNAGEAAITSAAASGSADSSVTVYSGSYSSTGTNWDDCPIYWAGHGTLTLYGGSFKNKVNGTGAAALLQKNGSVLVHGGEFEAKDGFKAPVQENTTEIVTVIDGGTFTGSRSGIYIDGSNAGYVQKLKQYSVKINASSEGVSPSFIGGDNGAIYVKAGGFGTNQAPMEITGGSFNTDPSKYVVDGYEVTSANGMFSVTKPVPPTPPSGGGGSTFDKTDVEHNQDGSTTTTVTKPDGSQTITHATATGTESVVKKDSEGNVTSTEVSVSKQDAASGKVELPIGKSEPAADADKAPEVEVKVPATVTADKPVQVTVPVAKEQGAEPNYGIVVYAVDEDGSETVLPKCAVDEDGNVAFEATGNVTIKVVDNAKDMPDVTDADWFAGGVVDFVTARGIVNGVDTPSGKQFQGYGKTSRGMLVAMLHNLELNPEAVSDASLPDIPDGAFYADAAAWALEEGILSGVDMPDGTKQFQGNADVTREQVAVFLMRYAQYLGMDVSKRSEIDFPDAGEVSGFAKDAMSWAVANGLFTGNDVTGELNPTDGAARAEVAAVLMRFISLMYA